MFVVLCSSIYSVSNAVRYNKNKDIIVDMHVSK